MVVLTTDEYWDAGGLQLNTVAYDIETLTGRLTVPQSRGNNTQIPYMPGERWQSKVFDARTITLAMWLRGSNKVDWNKNFDTLVRAFCFTDQLIPLTKRWTLPAPIGLLSATAQAEYLSGLDPNMRGRTLAKLGITLRLPNPWFYAPTITTPNIVRGGSSQSIVNPGLVTVDRYGVFVTLVGPLSASNNVLTATASGKPTRTLNFNTTIGSGDSVVLDVENFTAIRASDSANMIQYVDYDGGRTWMCAYPGTTNYTLTGTSGTGYATVAVRPAYA